MKTNISRRLTVAFVAPCLLLFCVTALSPSTAARAQARHEVDRNDESTRSSESSSSRSDSSSNSSSSSSSSNSSSNSSSDTSSSSSSSNDSSSSSSERGRGDEGRRGGHNRGDGEGRGRGEGRHRGGDDRNPVGGDGAIPPREQPGGSGSGTGGGTTVGGEGRNQGGGGGGEHRREHGGGRDKDDGHHRRHHARDHETQVYQQDDQNTRGMQGGVNERDECERGYQDGLHTGASDARRGQSNDPQRSHYYKNGGGGLFSWGRSGAARQAYRDCFLRGYEEGYRQPDLY